MGPERGIDTKRGSMRNTGTAIVGGSSSASMASAAISILCTNAERDPNQLLYEVDVDGYVHVVPVVREGRVLFLKTIYPTRKTTRGRRKGGPA